jgi:hypothetical protein
VPAPTPERLAQINEALCASVAAYDRDTGPRYQLPIAEALPDRWAGTLSWGVGAQVRGSALMFGFIQCSECGLPASCISPPSKQFPNGRSVHKLCAEQWHREHPRTGVGNDPATL